MKAPTAFSALLLALYATGVRAGYGENPDDPAAQQAAIAALPRAESRALVTESRAILGLSQQVVATSMPLEKALQALNAQVVGQVIEMALSSDVLFDFDADQLKPEAEPSLQAVLAVLNNSDVARVEIIGHTDAKGTEAYNQDLSLRRAHAVETWLTHNGVDGTLIQTEGRGESQPVAPNRLLDGRDNPEGRARNRRVEIRVHTRKAT